MAVPENAIPELWAPAVAVGNLLALYWLLKAFLLFHPHVAAALRRKLLRLRTVCCRTPSAQGVAAAEEGRAETAGGGGGGGEKELSRHSTDSLGAAAGEAGQQSALSPAAVAGLGGGSGSVVRKLTLPVTPLLLTWKDIGCTVTESSTGAQKVGGERMHLISPTLQCHTGEAVCCGLMSRLF